MSLLSIQFVLPIIIILAIGTIVFCVYYFSSKQILLRQLSKIRLKAIASLKSNEFIKIYGKALHVQEPLVAPLSKRKCIFYTIKIEKRVSSGKSSHWKTIVNEERIQDFFIEQNGSYAIIKPITNPKNYISHLVIDKKTASGSFNDPTPEFEALLKIFNIDSTNFFGFNKQLRYKEGIIEVGEKVTVAGIVKWKTLNEPIPEYSYSKIVALESDAKQKLIITDNPKAFNPLNRRL